MSLTYAKWTIISSQTRRWPHPALSKGEGKKSMTKIAAKVLSFGEDLGEAKLPGETLSKRH